MKTRIFTVTLLALSIMSCGRGESADVQSDSLVATVDEAAVVEPVLTNAESDSLSKSLGVIAGYDLVEKLSADHQQQSFDQPQYLQGFKTAMSAEKISAGTVAGLRAGAELMQMIRLAEAQGHKINRELVMKGFRAIYQLDSIPADTDAVINNQYNQLLNR